MSADDCERIHGDVVLDQAGALLQLIEPLRGLSDGGETVRLRLASWDRSMAPDSTDAYVFAEVRARLVRSVSHAGPMAGLTGSRLLPAVFSPWFVVETRTATALDSVLAKAPTLGIDIEQLVRDAVESVAAHLDELDTTVPTWGDVHVLAPIHGLDLVGASRKMPELSARVRPHPQPLGGDSECVFANGSAVGFSHACSVGSAARYVWDLADRNAARWIVPLGASGDPRSTHFQDQATRWAAGELIDVITDWSVLRTQAQPTDDAMAGLA